MTSSLETDAAVGRRAYTLGESLEFAGISGDHNPMHIDPLAARRTAFGKPVVHGIHLVLDGLQALCEHLGEMQLVVLKGTFLKAVRVGDEVSFSFDTKGEKQYRISISADRLVAFVDVTLEPSQLVRDTPIAVDEDPATLRLVERRFSDVAEAKGRIPLRLNRSGLRQRFPAVFRCLPIEQLEDIVGTSTLVGMECPGKHSLYSRFQIRFSNSGLTERQQTVEPREMEYSVQSSDKRFRSITMNVTTDASVGEIVAFVRPEPTPQLALDEAKNRVRPGEFTGVRALVVGGSRGLGEAATKLLALGGAEVVSTYSRGRDDAERLQQEMTVAELPIQITRLDVLDSRAFALEFPSDATISVCYFATPAISGSEGGFSSTLFEEFCRYYVTGLSRLIETLLSMGYHVGHVLAPSSVFVETLPRGMGEYAAAKAASEVVCRQLAQRGIAVHCPRWPRMLTDQTASVVPETYADTATVLLDSLRSLVSQ